MKKLLIVIFILLCSAPCIAGTQAASSCSSADITTAIAAASDGDTITIPSGNCTWNAGLATDLSTKGLDIEGAGQGSTIITDNTGATSTVWTITIADGYPVTVSGITFDSNAVDKSNASGLLKFVGIGSNNRIYNVTFDNIGDRGLIWMSAGGELYGLIDNCIFNWDGGGSEQAISIFGNGATTWGAAHAFGTADAVYVEQCTFNWNNSADSAIDAYDGAKIVVRHNTIHYNNVGFHGCDTGGYRSTFSFEVYENTFNNLGVSQEAAMGIRGGTGVVYNNAWIGNFKTWLKVTLYRTCTDYTGTWEQCTGAESVGDGNDEGPTGTSGTATGGGATSMTHTGAGWGVNDYAGFYVHNETEGTLASADCIALIDSNTSDTLTLNAQLGASCSGDSTFANTEVYTITLGYPCLDAPGRTTNQALSPMYEWGNTEDGSDINWAVINIDCLGSTPEATDHLTIGTDLINDTEMPGYTAYTYPHPLSGSGVASASYVSGAPAWTYSAGGITITAP